MGRGQWSHVELLELAEEAIGNAYAPYSGFRVAAAVLADEGDTYVGVNVENASYGLTICAERSAVFAAVSCGAKEIKAISVVAMRDEEHVKVSPCGACRQVLLELMSCDASVILGEDHVVALKELLPIPFGADSFG